MAFPAYKEGVFGKIKGKVKARVWTDICRHRIFDHPRSANRVGLLCSREKP